MFSLGISLGFSVFSDSNLMQPLFPVFLLFAAMVVITEITSRDIRTVSGIWTIEPDGSWVFNPNTHNAVKRVSIRDREKVGVVRELIRESYGSEYVGRDLHMSYQWTDWMGTPPVPIKTNEAMSVYMNMSSEVADLSLLVSLVNVEELINGEENSNTSTVDETTCKFLCLLKVLSVFRLIFFQT